ncbi:energy transducer TonB [Pontibacter sp. 172403-2]|uniref:energy transducer TonB n=1 Tax=Pontibacter rufus TaxID=2791028 RepID=UPI0018AFF139|nr:energy transducer TonB [Pontibacter sp. 172403-2]MBF9252820.1 energy transducer TonB [Pontibacter sp. 172403-2]
MKKLMQTKTALIFSCFTCLLFTAACSTDEEPAITAQEQKQEREEITAEKADTSEIYAFVEQMPEFKGGEAAMLEFLGSNIKYPKAAQEAGVEGLTVLSFVVEKDGSITDIRTLKSLSPETDKEAIRVVKLMSGDWKPGSQNGVPVRTKYTLPIRYTIK